MKTLVTIEIENEIGDPSIEDIKSFMGRILEKGRTIDHVYKNLEIFKDIPMRAISLRISNIEKLENK